MEVSSSIAHDVLTRRGRLHLIWPPRILLGLGTAQFFPCHDESGEDFVYKIYILRATN